MSTTELFFVLSRMLLIPLILGLGALAVWTLLEIGGFFCELITRKRKIKAWLAFSRRLLACSDKDLPLVAKEFFKQSDYHGYVQLFAVKGAPFASRENILEKILTDLEIEAVHAAQRMNLGVRLGPALGLIGTLIPLGPAMVTLSSGQLGSAASDLAVAFATTIVGLICSVTCYTMYLVRSKWYAKDISDNEYIFSLLDGESSETDS